MPRDSPRWPVGGAPWRRGRRSARAPAEESLAPLPDARTRAGRAAREVVEALAGAAAYVGNDSGPSHLAGALGTAGVVLFGPTDPARWRPLVGASRRAARASDAWTPDGFRLPPARDVVRSLARGALP
jgi:hypothetical protein